MLDRENSDKLLNSIMSKIDTLFPGTTGTDKLAKQFAQIAATVSVIALQEYEKLGQ